MAIEYNVYDCDGFVSSTSLYMKWMSNLLVYVEQQDSNSDYFFDIWDNSVTKELKEYSAHIVHDDVYPFVKIIFENEELATLFFLKFS